MSSRGDTTVGIEHARKFIPFMKAQNQCLEREVARLQAALAEMQKSMEQRVNITKPTGVLGALMEGEKGF